MPRLRTVSPQDPGWTRRRAGKGFVYLDLQGGRLAVDDIDRCKLLVIPPAWEAVWICPAPNGHIQAVGTDDAGRRQYIYHEAWRRKRDKSKHDRVLQVAARLPRARRKVAVDLDLEGMPYERALATAFRLLDLGFFRIGGEAYAEANDSYGLATIRKEHVTIDGKSVVFDYVAKSGQDRFVAVADDRVRAAVRDLLLRRRGGPELLAYRDGKTWRDVSSAEINDYIKGKVGGEVSAKDFRTWHGTVIAAVALAGANETATTVAKRKKAVSQAMRAVVGVSRQHADGGASFLRRSAGRRPVPRRSHHLAQAGLPRRRPLRRHHPRQDREGGAEPAGGTERQVDLGLSHPRRQGPVMAKV